MASAPERMTERLVALVRPSELKVIKELAQRVNLTTSDYVRKSALGDLPPSFDLLAEELMASATRAHKGLDAAIAAIQASEVRMDALAAQAGQRHSAAQ